MNRELVVDISGNQGGRINFDVFAANNPAFVAVRATISWGYQDKWFPFYWQSLKARGIPRTAYHVIYPGESPTRQIDNLFRALGDDIGEIEPVLDIELNHGQTPRTIINNVKAQADLIERRIGKNPLMYSRSQWVNYYMPGCDWLNDYYWWMALYLNDRSREHPGPVPAPRGMAADRIILHQNADKYPSKPFGIHQGDAKCIDINRWVGRMPITQFLKCVQPPLVAVPPVTYKVKPWVFLGLRLRNKPVSGSVLEVVPANTQVTYAGETQDKWIKVTHKEKVGWMHLDYVNRIEGAI